MKRKKIIILFIALSLCGILVVCLRKNYDVQVGFYETKDALSYLELKEDGTFNFLRHIAGNMITGEYSVEKNILKLHSSLGEYEFYIKNKKIIFKKGNAYTDKLVKKGTKYFYKT